MTISHTGTLLVVCAANVCRSPYAEFLLAAQLLQASVRSAGIEAEHGTGVCEQTREALLRLPEGEAFATSHKAVRVDANWIAEADLILTATADIRGKIARVEHQARSRTFTLVEAGLYTDSLEETAFASATDLAEVAALLHGQRGKVPLPAVTPSRWFRHREWGIDVPDVHMGETRSHDEVHTRIERAVERFAHALGASES